MAAKVQKTSRIRVCVGQALTTLYVSTEIVRDTREFTVRLENNVMVPQRNRMDALKKRLCDLLDEKPEHFTAPAATIIANLGA